MGAVIVRPFLHRSQRRIVRLLCVQFIPREDDITRIYCQLEEEDVLRMEDGRIDMSKERRVENEKKVADVCLPHSYLL